MFKTPIYSLNPALQSLIVLVGVLAFCGLIVLGVIVFKKKFKKFDIEKPEISEEQAVQEELDRVLVPIEEDLVEAKSDDEAKKD